MNFNPFAIFKATKPTEQLRTEIGFAKYGDGIPSSIGMKRPSPSDLVQRIGRWVDRCASLNAQAASCVKPRLFSVGQKEAVEKCAPFRPRPLDVRTKAFLRGRMAVKPGVKAMAKISGHIDDMTEIQEHPLLDLLNTANDWQEGSSFLFDAYYDRQIFGGFYWHLIGPIGGMPTALVRLRPTLMRVVPSPTDFVDHFEYGTGTQRYNLRAEEVLWVYRQHPDNPWSMYGPLEAWYRTVDADIAMVDFQDWIFKRGGTPDVVIAAKGMNADGKKTFRTDWRNLFGFMRNRQTNVAILDGEAEVHKLGGAPREMEYKDSRKQSRDEIGQAFGIPNDILATENANRATSKESWGGWQRDTVYPMVLMTQDALNQRLLPRYGEGLVLIHENPVPEDETIRVQVRESKLKSGWSVNEIRLEEGEEPLDEPNADESLIGSGVSLLSKLGEDPLGLGLGLPGSDGKLPPNGGRDRNDPEDGGGRQQGAGDADNPNGDDKSLAGQGDAQHRKGADTAVAEVGGSAGQVPPPVRGCDGHDHRGCVTAKGALHDHWNTKVADAGDGAQSELPDDKLRRMRDAIARVFRSQGREAAERMAQAAGMNAATAQAMVVAIVLDAKWVDELVEGIRPYVTDILVESGQHAMDRVGGDGVFNVTNPKVQEFVDSYVVRLASNVNEFTGVQLSRLLGDGIKRGETIAELTNRVRTWAEESDPERGSPWRAERIARTESARAYIAGQEEGWKESGVVLGKQWLLAPDACEFCQAAADEFKDHMVQLGKAFYQQGTLLRGTDGGTMVLDYGPVEGPPLHPQCLLPQTSVLARGVVAAYTSFYDGQAVELELADGTVLAVTANHPLLTPNGLVSAHALGEGDYVVRCPDIERVVARDPDNNYGPAAVEDVVRSLAVSTGMFACRVPVTAEHFHGDGRSMDGDIHVVASERLLDRTLHAALFKHGHQKPLCWAWDRVKLAGLCDLDAMLVTMSFAANGVVRRTSQHKALAFAGAPHAYEHGVSPAPWRESIVDHSATKGQPVTTRLIRKGLDGFSRLVSADEIMNVRQFNYTGHVYNLQTESGLYIGNSILTSNCRCDLIPVLASDGDEA